MIEIDVTISFYRDLPLRHSLEQAQAARLWEGTIMGRRLHVLQVPRIGDGLASLGPLQEPIAVWVTGVNHHLDLPWHDDPAETTRTSPSIEVIAHAPWPRSAERDDLVGQFEARGWHWLSAHE